MLRGMFSEIRERLEAGYTLPAGWYSDSAILALERERIFKHTWQYACVTAEVSEPGDYFATKAGTIPVVLVRDKEGELKGFVNVCRHRGHVVMQGSGHRETLQCPYHAWTYGLDGCLLKAPRSEREPGFDADNYSLFPVQVDTWGPFIFVNVDLEADSLSETLGVLPETVAETGIDLDSLKFHHRGEYVIEANWKIAVENYLECYHCPVAHPGFSSVINVDPDAYALASSGYVSTQKGPVRSSVLEGKKAAPYDATGEHRPQHVGLRLPELHRRHHPRPAEHERRRLVPDRRAAHARHVRLLLLRGRAAEDDRGDDRLQRAGRARGQRARRVGARRTRVGHGRARPPPADERAPDPALPAPDLQLSQLIGARLT